MPRPRRLPAPRRGETASPRRGAFGVSGSETPTASEGPSPGTLYFVATPIGDPDDITLRALRALRAVDIIAAEDPRVTRRLLERHGIAAPLLAYRPQRREPAAAAILAHLKAGRSVAFVTDAGTPGIADPGAALAAEARKQGAPVSAVPGPSALLAALSVSGQPATPFLFCGFAPRSRADRHAFFAALAGEKRTLALFESAAYLRDTLERLESALGSERPAVLASNLTRPDERLLSGSLSEVLESVRCASPRGKFTVIVGPE